MASAAWAAPVDVTVDASHPGAHVAREQFGINEPDFIDVTRGEVVRALSNLGIGLIRWPGGSGDVYHWARNANGPGYCSTYAGTVDPHDDFDAFMTKLARPLGAAVAVQVNYGSDATCTGGGDPAEAAAWVAYARKKHYDVRLWTIGNEQWADFALDLHVTTHDPWRYSWEINTRYYPMMKAADPAIQIGIDVEGTADSRWDSIVLKYAKYDFVDVHVYPEMPPHDDDWLLRQGPGRVAAVIEHVREALRRAGRPATPVFVGEWNSAAYDLGKQSTSIVEALFAGMTAAQMLEMGVPYAAFFDGFEPSCGMAPGDRQLYGSLPFGSWSLFSAGAQTDTWPGTCPHVGRFPPSGTPYPAARALAMVRAFAVPGQAMLPVRVDGEPGSGASGPVRAYAVSGPAGYRVLLVNLDRTQEADATIAFDGASATEFDLTTQTYGKAEYDRIAKGIFLAPVRHAFGPRTAPFAVALPPWSMTLVDAVAR